MTVFIKAQIEIAQQVGGLPLGGLGGEGSKKEEPEKAGTALLVNCVPNVKNNKCNRLG